MSTLQLREHTVGRGCCQMTVGGRCQVGRWLWSNVEILVTRATRRPRRDYRSVQTCMQRVRAGVQACRRACMHLTCAMALPYAAPKNQIN